MYTIDMPVLAGTDTNRHPAVLVVTPIDGRLCDALTCVALTVVRGTVLAGWGALDGPAYTLSNGVDVPVATWHACVDAFWPLGEVALWLEGDELVCGTAAEVAAAYADGGVIVHAGGLAARLEGDTLVITAVAAV